MSNWGERYRSYPWSRDNKATTFGCTNEGGNPNTIVTGGRLSQKGVTDAIALMAKCFGEKVSKDIAPVLRKAGASLEGVSHSSQTQTDLRKMARSIDANKYEFVQTRLLEICHKRSMD